MQVDEHGLEAKQDEFRRFNSIILSGDEALAYLSALKAEPRAYEHVKLEGTFKTPGEYLETENKANYRPLFTTPMPAAVSDATVAITVEEAEKLCERLEFDASWDKAGSGYYSLKRQVKALQAAIAADGRG